jgi:[2Fe-2S] binding domain
MSHDQHAVTLMVNGVRYEDGWRRGSYSAISSGTSCCLLGRMSVASTAYAAPARSWSMGCRCGHVSCWHAKRMVTSSPRSKAWRTGRYCIRSRRLWHEAHGLQCGYCHPGIAMTISVFLAETPSPSEPEIREALSGHLCRCTGYQHIIDAVKLAADRLKAAHRS